MTKTDSIVLLHGIFNNVWDLMPTSLYMRAQGYDVHSLGYNTRIGGIDAIAAHVWKNIQERGLDHHTVRLHFIAHSMGGIVTDSLIRQFRPANLGRVVMWGTPLQGCEHADNLNDSVLGGLYRLLGGQSGQDLQIRSHDPARSQPMQYEAGMVAGTRSINPLSSVFLKDVGEHDGVVPLNRTHREGLKDHLTVAVTHPGLLYSPLVKRQTLHFLREGVFARLA